MAKAQANRNSTLHPVAMRPPLSYIEDKAYAAQHNDPASVRAFTDEIFARTVLNGAAPSLSDRLYRNEVAFRGGQHAGVSEDDLVTAVNARVSLFGLPKYMRTTRGQAHIAREDLREHVRHYANNDTRQRSPAAVLSPAEAVLVSADLAFQKVINPRYQVEPEQFEEDVANRRAQAKAHTLVPPKSGLEVRTLSAGYASTKQQLADESSEVVSNAHSFLDAIGFQR
jgi:hypothetical protein